MQHLAFGEFFPEIAAKETRTVICVKKNAEGLPPEKYVLFENYWTDVDCDCRRVLLSVMSESDGKHHLTINYGWEPRSYYVKWMGDDEKLFIDDLRGPCRNIFGPDSELADGILEMVKKTALKDKQYVERLGRHYRMFKEKVNAGKVLPQKQLKNAPFKKTEHKENLAIF